MPVAKKVGPVTSIDVTTGSKIPKLMNDAGDQPITPRFRPRPQLRQPGAESTHSPANIPSKDLSGPLEPGNGESFEFGPSNPLPALIPERIRKLAQFCRGEARREVMQHMAPLFLQGATAAQIAPLFGISVISVKRWRAQYRQLQQEELLSKSAIEQLADATSRIEVFRSIAFAALKSLDNDQSTKIHRLKISYLGKLIELERTQLSLNSAYGVAHPLAFSNAQREAIKAEPSAEALLQAVKGFMDEVAGMKDMSLDELEACLGATSQDEQDEAAAGKRDT